MYLILFWFRILVLKFFCVIVCSNFVRFSYKVRGGHDADKGSWNFIVAITCGRVVHCGGSLIRPKWVVTAAHCVQGDNIDSHIKYFGRLNVGIGRYDLDFVDIKTVLRPDEHPEIFAKVSAIRPEDIREIDERIVHPEFYTSKITKQQEYKSGNIVVDVVCYDVAMIKLKNDAEGPCLALPTKSVYSTKFCRTAGWGAKSIRERYVNSFSGLKNVLQELQLGVVEPQECVELLTAISRSCDASEKNTNCQNTNKICCKSYGISNRVYSGDSGCPLVCDGEFQGIANLAVEQSPSETKITFSCIFTEVARYTKWMNLVLKENGDKGLDDNVYSAKCCTLISYLWILCFCTFLHIFL